MPVLAVSTAVRATVGATLLSLCTSVAPLGLRSKCINCSSPILASYPAGIPPPLVYTLRLHPL